MPIILYTLFAVSVLPVLLAWVGAVYRVRQFAHLDNRHPREQQARLEGAGARIHAAQINAWEALAVYVSTCFIAFAAGTDMATLTAPALTFVGARLLHPVCYALNLHWLRSLVFAVGMGACLAIIAMAMG
ncbi:MAPEG family protein [Halomonas sp. V046]|uniref:MAPEG family protein n=1 Tax=Halomonas sp. V046 TaxID=3459611 RepID=UPI004044C7D8